MTRTLRAALAVLTSVAGAATVPATAAAAASCHFDATTRVLTVTADASGGVAAAGGRVVVVSRFQEVDCTGPDATTTNTDTVTYENTGALSGRRTSVSSRITPGFTDEGGPDESEIEVIVSGSPAVTVHGGGLAARIVAGTSGDETRFNVNPGETVPDADVTVLGVGVAGVHYTGSAGDDVFDARGGAGTGAELASALTAEGESGDDTLYGGAGAARLDGGFDDDTLTAGSGPATLLGDPWQTGNDTLTGGPADDVLIPAGGNDTVSGAGGMDTLRFVAQPIMLDLAKTTRQYTMEGLDTFRGGIDIVEAGEGGNVIRGTSAAETFRTGDGDDLIAGRGGADRLEAGPGNDVADFSGAPTAVSIDAYSTAPQADGRGSFDTLIGVEGAVGTAYADTLRGNKLEGGAGADKLVAVAGFRDYYGISSRVSGGEGADELQGSGQSDLLDAGPGGDKLLGENGSDLLYPGSNGTGAADGADEINAGGGMDTLSYEDRTGGVAVKLDGLRNEGADPNGDGISSADEEGDLATSVEFVNGGSGPDRFQAPYTGHNIFRGMGGDDWMDAGPSRDQMHGGDGVDTVSYAGRTRPVAISLDAKRNDGADPDRNGSSNGPEENDLIGYDVENAVGGAAADRLSALSAWAVLRVNVLTGGPGADFLDVRDGSSVVDQLLCGDDADTYKIDASDTTADCETAVP